MGSPENHPFRPVSIVVSLAALTLSCAAAAHASESSASCRCMLTFSTGPAHESYCDGFDTATHGSCTCEKQTNSTGAVACVPKAARSGDSVAADRSERRSHRGR